jgi:hypothetical protein
VNLNDHGGLDSRAGGFHGGAMTCDHRWLIEAAKSSGGHTPRSIYRCARCRAVTRKCPMGDHPYGFPAFEDPRAYCAWCQTPSPFTEQ